MRRRIIHRKRRIPVGLKRWIIGEELAVVEGEELAGLLEVLSCGHRQPGQYTESGDFTAQFRYCKACLEGRPINLPIKILNATKY
jgi:hypothetical protein